MFRSVLQCLRYKIIATTYYAASAGHTLHFKYNTNTSKNRGECVLSRLDLCAPSFLIQTSVVPVPKSLISVPNPFFCTVYTKTPLLMCTFSSILVCLFVCISRTVCGPQRARLPIQPTATLSSPSCLWQLRMFPSPPDSRLRIFIVMQVQHVNTPSSKGRAESLEEMIRRTYV